MQAQAQTTCLSACVSQVLQNQKARLIAGNLVFFLQAQAQVRGEAPGIDLVVAADVAPYFGARLSLLLQGVLGAQFTCCTGTKVQILTQKALKGGLRASLLMYVDMC